MLTMETARDIIGIMDCCKAEYMQRHNEAPSEQILCMLTDRTHRQMLSDSIQKQRQGVPQRQETNEPRPASEKQLKYIDDLGGDSSQIHTAKEASDEISRLKSR